MCVIPRGSLATLPSQTHLALAFLHVRAVPRSRTPPRPASPRARVPASPSRPPDGPWTSAAQRAASVIRRAQTGGQRALKPGSSGSGGGPDGMRGRRGSKHIEARVFQLSWPDGPRYLLAFKDFRECALILPVAP